MQKKSEKKNMKIQNHFSQELYDFASNKYIAKGLHHFMLYGTEGEGRGRKSKYTVLPRGGRVQFEF